MNSPLEQAMLKVVYSQLSTFFRCVVAGAQARNSSSRPLFLHLSLHHDFLPLCLADLKYQKLRSKTLKYRTVKPTAFTDAAVEHFNFKLCGDCAQLGETKIRETL